MVYPVSGQQIPAANTFQPGGSVDTPKRPEENKRPDETKVQGAESARSQTVETRSNAQVERSRGYDVANDQRSVDSGSVSASSSRGTNLNITV